MSLSRQLAFSFLFFFSDIFNSFTLFPLIANSAGVFVHFYFLCSNKLYWLVWRPRNLLLRELPLEYKEKDDFVPLKSFSGLEYQKIVGCYVIRNNENKKYYVGQSKDVIKRLKQHFKGTVPKNIVFAEDYFSSNQKDNLFSVKILHLTTKDQLDKKERELIEFYDSRNNGYNGTAGNSD